MISRYLEVLEFFKEISAFVWSLHRFLIFICILYVRNIQLTLKKFVTHWISELHNKYNVVVFFFILIFWNINILLIFRLNYYRTIFVISEWRYYKKQNKFRWDLSFIASNMQKSMSAVIISELNYFSKTIILKYLYYYSTHNYYKVSFSKINIFNAM